MLVRKYKGLPVVMLGKDKIEGVDQYTAKVKSKEGELFLHNPSLAELYREIKFWMVLAHTPHIKKRAIRQFDEDIGRAYSDEVVGL